MNEAALLTARATARTTMVELENAVDRVMVGPERRSRHIGEKEKSITAYHEAGHALVAHLSKGADPVHKVSIVPRDGRWPHRLLPVEDRYLWTDSQLSDWLAYALGGMAAEEITFGEMTTGSSNDLEQATERARQMVSRYGMSDEVGPMSLGRDDHQVFLGRELGMGGREYSEETAALIDSEVRRLVNNARERARSLLDAHRERLALVARRLLEQETLRGEELAEALGPRPSRPSSADNGRVHGDHDASAPEHRRAA